MGDYTLGIEEEFQLVDRATGQLRQCAHSLVEKSGPLFGDRLKLELMQSTIELVSNVYTNIAEARTGTYRNRALLIQFLAEESLVPLSAGTHPEACWQDQKIADTPRYARNIQELQDVSRSFLVFGLHIHVGIKDKDLAIWLMNRLRTWLPHLLALSTNSPFWAGRFTGLKSYRGIVWKQRHRSGIPDIFASASDWYRHIAMLLETGCIDDGRSIWWDIRPHPFFETLEFRIFDMPATIEDTIALAALCQALVAKLVKCYKDGYDIAVLSRDWLEENKWRVLRYGLDAEIIDFVSGHQLTARDSIRELLAFINDVVDELGSRGEMEYLQNLLDSPYGTGADRQIALYQQTGDMQQVLRLLEEQCVRYIVH
jgi:carboxylate-amine ligase